MLVPLRRVGINGGSIEHFAGMVHNCCLAASSEPRIDPQNDLARQGRLVKQPPQVLSKNPDGMGLSLFGQTAADIPVETVASLGMMYGPIVAGFAVFSVWLTLQCKMTRADHESVVAQLAARRQASEAT